MKIAVVYLVAGLSSRFNWKIKSFVKVTEDETLIEYSLNQALPAGFSKIIFVVGKHTKKQFRKKFGNSYKGIPIEYCLQEYNPKEREKPWGTADALCSIKNIIDCPFVICSGDDLYGKENIKLLFNHLKNSDGEATIGARLESMTPEEGNVNRGIFEIDKDCNVKDIKETLNISKSDLISEKLDKNSFCSMSIFALHPKILDLLSEGLVKFKEENAGNRKIEYYLSDELAKLIKQNKMQMKLYPSSNPWFGITNPEDEFKIREQLKNN